ncbi:MAG: sulfotransferase, partial [Cyanobacteria bacterium P01_H01_bin.15]
MSEWVGAIILVVGFIVLIQLFKLVPISQKAIAVAQRSLAIINAADLDDDEKEARLQRNSIQLFVFFFQIIAVCIAAFLIPIAVLYLGERAGLVSLKDAISTTISPIFIGVSFALVLGWLFWQGSQSKSPDSSDYSPIEQSLHQVAFSTYQSQVGLADLEGLILGKPIKTVILEKPVFITALPRAGTTLLLECCASVPEFAAHCYRDMPFVMVPLFWNRFSRIFQQSVESKERAHGDGMQINPDSPEALEEVIWKTFWQRHYKDDRIIPWDIETNSDFKDFTDSHFRKIIWLRRGHSNARYVSKNNANIARIPLLKRLYPDSIIIIPFRDPYTHAASLLQQHLNFLDIHKQDSFASEYMAAIGHYDFGENLRPIDFDGWFDQRQTPDATSIAFWLEYWLASYQFLLKTATGHVSFLHYESLCANPEAGLSRLADTLQSQNPQAFLDQSNRLRPPRPKTIYKTHIPKFLLQSIDDTYSELKAVSVNYAV